MIKCCYCQISIFGNHCYRYKINEVVDCSYCKNRVRLKRKISVPLNWQEEPPEELNTVSKEKAWNAAVKEICLATRESIFIPGDLGMSVFYR